MNANRHLPRDWRPLFKADWTRFLFVNYSVPAECLTGHGPLELELRAGRALVSLVFFRFDHMHPAAVIPPVLGKWLMRPASGNWFLNVRTYVRGPAGPGILFLVEWMDNALSRWIGPKLYGLPYRKGEFEVNPEGDRISVTDPVTGQRLTVRVPAPTRAAAVLKPGSMDAGFLERYTAYTCRRGVPRYFRIEHPVWKAAPVGEPEIDGDMVRQVCPWFGQARFESALVADGFADVLMGVPHLAGEAPVPAAIPQLAVV